MRKLFFAVSLIIVLVACGDDKSSSPKGLPDEVADMDELEEIKCNMSTIGAVVYVNSKSKNYECDGDEWFESYNQKKSSSSVKSLSCSSVALNETSGKSSSSAKSSSSSVKSNVVHVIGSVYDSIANTLKDLRDGQVYRTVRIDDQIWMAENLNYAYLQSTKELDSSSFCYNDSLEYCEKYGRLYLWSAAMDSVGVFSENSKRCGSNINCDLNSPVRGICPDGWHIPSYTDFLFYLYYAVGGKETAARELKSSNDWKYKGGLDKAGFSVLPAGYRANNGEFVEKGTFAGLWTSDMLYENSTLMVFRYDRDDISDVDFDRSYAFSVRCLKNIHEENEGVSSSSSFRSESEELNDSNSSSSRNGCKTEMNDDCEYGLLTDGRDGQSYRTVKIGNQWWMAENLNYAYLQPTEDLDSSSFCFQETDNYCGIYGRLYMWSAAMDSAGIFGLNGKDRGDDKILYPVYPVRGVCPEGWHLPSKAEWNVLLAVVGGSGALASVEGWWLGSKSDRFGFSTLPAGSKKYKSEYNSGTGQVTGFWSSSEYSINNAYCMYLVDRISYSTLAKEPKNMGYSVRCVKD